MAVAPCSERFTRVPERFLAMLDRGEITFDHFGVMVVLVGNANYRRRSVTFPSLKTLIDQCGWRRTDRHLRDVLRELRDDHGEIAFQKSQGSRSAYEITIVHGDWFGGFETDFNLEQEASDVAFRDDNLEQERPSSFQVSPFSFQVAEAHSKLAASATPDHESDSASPFQVPVPSSTEATSIATREEEDLGEGTLDPLGTDKTDEIPSSAGASDFLLTDRERARLFDDLYPRKTSRLRDPEP